LFFGDGIRENTADEDVPLPGYIPWNLIQTITIIQLYIEERWVELVKIKRYPYSLLYHQTMSILASTGEISPKELARKVLSLPPFKAITLKEFTELIDHLLRIDHIELTEEGGLIMGLEGGGTDAFRALHRCIKHYYLNKGKARLKTSEFPYYMTLQGDSIEPQKLIEEITDFCNAKTGYELIDDEEIYPYHRYDDYLPFKFLKKAFIHDFMDIQELKVLLAF